MMMKPSSRREAAILVGPTLIHQISLAMNNPDLVATVLSSLCSADRKGYTKPYDKV